jgi:hypothetical protein
MLLLRLIQAKLLYLSRENRQMRKLLIIGIALGLGSALIAQSAEDDVVRLKQAGALGPVEVVGEEGAPGEMEPQASQVNQAKQEKERKGQLNMSVGTSFSYMQNYGSFMGFQAVPTYTLPLNQRWSLHAGVIASTYYGLGPTPDDGFMGYPVAGNSRMTNLSVFAAASYKASDKLTLYGSGVKSLMSYPMPPLMGYPSDRLSFGANYRLGDNVTIGASMHFRQRGGYHSTSPFNSTSPFYSPFGW